MRRHSFVTAAAAAAAVVVVVVVVASVVGTLDGYSGLLSGLVGIGFKSIQN